MSHVEEPGSFYLGRRHDLATGTTLDEPLVYDSKHLTTHAVCVGMTGSGKTGLCISLLEEAALDGIPAIAIDPKGDLGNLLLAFPNLSPDDFRPWVDESEATRRQMSADQFAASQAELWRNGLAKWNEGPERIRRYCEAVERVIYTPGSSAGIPITVLKSFRTPPTELIGDVDAYSERISAAASGLLTLLGVDADPVRSREHIFMSNVFDAVWRSGRDLDLRQMIENIQRPPFERIGVVDLESFYPATDRYKFAMQLNNLLASPTFASWLEGVPLDIGRLLYAPNGKPQLAVISIAHLDDAQRMFFVTLLLNEVVAWMRTQPGTGSLRALLYMDEVFGYFPPLANPPSKRPMLTLLKQARAFGLGCVLATQNPVDLDYKGLSNAGTWFLGRLQTERDKARVIEGLEGASAQAGAAFNRQQMEATLAALGQRVFLMNNVHEDTPVVFHTRWAMSYLAGPLTRTQIKTLTDPQRSNYVGASDGASSGETATTEKKSPAAGTSRRPVLPAGIQEEFAAVSDRVPDGYRLEYHPALYGSGKVHFVRLPSHIDHWQTCFLLQPLHETPPDDIWDRATVLAESLETDQAPDERGEFADLPSEMAREKNYAIFRRQLAEHLYRTMTLSLWRCDELDQISRPDESQANFRERMRPLVDAARTDQRHRIEQQFAKRLTDIEGRIQVAQTRVSTQKWQFWTRISGFLWVIVETVLRFQGMGRRGRPRSAQAAMRGVATERGQQVSAQAQLDKLVAEKQALEVDRDKALNDVDARYRADQLALVPFEIKPRKADIEIDRVALVWLPSRVAADGTAEPIYESHSSPDSADSADGNPRQALQPAGRPSSSLTSDP